MAPFKMDSMMVAPCPVITSYRCTGRWNIQSQKSIYWFRKWFYYICKLAGDPGYPCPIQSPRLRL